MICKVTRQNKIDENAYALRQNMLYFEFQPPAGELPLLP
jgi:hypothetical protein